MKLRKPLWCIALAFLIVATPTLAKEVKKDSYSLYVKGYPQRVLFGDTHLHTKYSTDAFGFGARLDDEAA